MIEVKREVTIEVGVTRVDIRSVKISNKAHPYIVAYPIGRNVVDGKSVSEVVATLAKLYGIDGDRALVTKLRRQIAGMVRMEIAGLFA